VPDVTFAPDADPRAFRAALGRFATGVTVVTTHTPDGPAGFTANSFASVSLDPALVLWSPARASARFPIFAQAAFYCIHVLGTEQAPLATRFLRGGDGFAGLDVDLSPEGMPILPGALARFDCAQHATHDGGDHLIVVGRVLRASMRDGAPLVFSQGAYGSFI
jgi:flavin reductase (DIM6/NTAB) family NADH-FMN oxidoreductase RutF